MKQLRNGFSVIEVLIIVAVLVLLGALAYVGWNAMMNDREQNAAAETKTSDAQDAAPIESTKDLDSATETLDSTEVEDGSAAEAESQASL